jgi:cephalosporin-C deacetylase-like acetyl esterase
MKKQPGDDIKHYTWLHSTSQYGYCPNDLARALEVVLFLKAQLNRGQSVLDCSAGRGIALRFLAMEGIECHATEADPFLCEHELKAYTPHNIRYDELATLQPTKYDAVVSVDVLEHLFTEEAVAAALRDLAALSKRWLCISVGLTEAHWECERSEMVTLHHVVRPPIWWHDEVAKVATVIRHYTFHQSEIIFAEVPQ